MNNQILEKCRLYDNSGIAIFSNSEMENEDSIFFENEEINFCYIRFLIFTSETESIRNKFLSKIDIYKLEKKFNLKIEEREILSIGYIKVIELATTKMPILEIQPLINILCEMSIPIEVVVC